MKAQALRNENGMFNYMGAKKIMEVNPSHPIMIKFKENIEADKDIKTIVELLFETVMIDSGFSIEEPSRYANKIYRLIQTGLNGEDQNEDEQDQLPNEDNEPTEEHIDISPLEEVD